MIIQPTKQLDIQTIAGNFETTEAGISQDSYPILFEMLSKNLYSNPIGSIVREYTSNCFDSHLEANVNEPVRITKGRDEEGTYISFIDVGVGLSPDRMKNIFMNYFSSTKRETDDLIGGFGLGSKSAISYTDFFYINTIFDGRKYQYIFSKGVTKPTLDLLSVEESTEHNGTEIRIYLLTVNGYNTDDTKFEKALKEQLCYFDNVWFDVWNIDNNYKIYEGNFFKWRNVHQYSEEMHIVLGKVSYPIDWNAIGLDPVNIPIGVKFNIGELLVTPNRENIRYTDELIALIQSRISSTIDELNDIFNKQSSNYDSFFDWWENRKQKAHILLGDDKLYLTGLKLTNKCRFTPLNNIGIYKFEFDDLARVVGYVCKGYIEYGKYKEYKNQYYNNIFNFFINGRKVLLTKKYTDLKGAINWKHNKGDVIKLEKAYYKTIAREISPAKLYDNKQAYFNLGFHKKVYEFIKIIRAELELKTQPYLIDLTAEELAQYKLVNIENNYSLKRKIEGKVYIKAISGEGYDWKIDNEDKSPNKKGIMQYNGIVVYGSRDDIKALEKATTFLSMFPTLSKTTDSRTYLDNRKAKVIIIAKNNFKHFQNRKNMCNVTDLYGDNKLFRKLASYFKVQDVLIGLNNNSGSITSLGFIDEIVKINADIGEELKYIQKFYKQFNSKQFSWTRYAPTDIKVEVLSIANRLDLFDPLIESKLRVINKWFEGIELIKFVDFNKDTLPKILVYLRKNKKRMNFDYYNTVVKEPLADFLDGRQVTINFPIEQQEVQTKFELLTN